MPWMTAFCYINREKSGLGIEIDEREAAKHPFQQEILQQMTFLEDGSVAEW